MPVDTAALYKWLEDLELIGENVVALFNQHTDRNQLAASSYKGAMDTLGVLKTDMRKALDNS